MEKNRRVILGFFPPPIDGQTLWTQRFAELISGDAPVARVDMSSGEAAPASTVRFRTRRAVHYANLRTRIKHQLREHPSATVVWPSVSPTLLGHMRDRLIVLPSLRPDQRIIAVVHWGSFDSLFRSTLTSASARRLVERVRGIVFLEKTLADRCAEWIPDEKRLVVPNTIRAELVCSEAELAAKREFRMGRSVMRILFVSNMIRSKGYLDVVRSLPGLVDRGVDLQADFAGGWESSEAATEFENELSASGLSTRVRHHGLVRDPERLRKLYLGADVFVLPTYYSTEAQPLAVLEALAAGTPIVTTRHASLPAMVRDSEAIFVPPRKPEAIADAVETLVDRDRWMRMSVAARNRFDSCFGPDVVRRRWETLLNTIEGGTAS
jgi:glycosyltransferase involved in cell wall biosynthesis